VTEAADVTPIGAVNPAGVHEMNRDSCQVIDRVNIEIDNIINQF
jgi:hypothetical protein